MKAIACLVMCVLATASAALDGHKSPKTIIECPNRASFDYIRSELKSSSDTVSLTFRNCYLTGFDFSFLVNYPNLESIEVVGGSLEEFVSMPFTPSLKAVSLDLPDFRRWHDPSMTPNIENITFTPRPYPGESAIEAIFAPLFYYHKTLRFLRLPDGEWTAVPSIVGSFTNLTEFYMVGFNLTVLKSGSFGPSNPRTITIEPCGLEIIEPGAFQGDFGDVTLKMHCYNVGTFDQSVFEPVLRSMYQYGSGFIDYDHGFRNCDCRLAWLLRDNRQYLPHVRGFCFAGCPIPQYCTDPWSPIEQFDPEKLVNCTANANLEQ